MYPLSAESPALKVKKHSCSSWLINQTPKFSVSFYELKVKLKGSDTFSVTRAEVDRIVGVMHGSKRIAKVNVVYHILNRANGWLRIFKRHRNFKGLKVSGTFYTRP